jgi:signal transduction histidine kinase
MIRQVDRFVKMTQEILDYSRGVSELHLETVQLSEVMEAAFKFIEVEFQNRNITIAREYHFTGPCKLDAERMSRVLYNLATNAADAMPNGGTLTVRTQKSAGNMSITIADTGTGIPDAIRAKVFEPFFTHGKRHGTGLGLAIAKKIIDEHGGEIHIESQENVGTTIRLLIPT